MALPEARPGLVFRYDYVWRRQDWAGQTVGEKDRPASIVLAVRAFLRFIESQKCSRSLFCRIFFTRTGVHFA